MDIKNLLDNCNNDCKTFLELIINQLEVQYGSVPPEFFPNMILIKDWYNVYLEAKDDVYKKGVTSRDAKDHVKKNRNFSVMNIAFTNISKIMNQFSLSPLNKVRMQKLQSTTQESKVSADDMLNNLFK